ncbi:MAG: DVUA0089 family protein, partial [Phycisphaerae bacterium]|nr:DVUA0089 family protein [Phycisphaerae bacterium]
WIGFAVDPGNAVAESNEANNINVGAGLDRGSFSSEANLPSPLAGSGFVATPLTLQTPITAGIGDEWIGAYDIDVFSFTVATAQQLAIDIDRASGPLDAYLRLYDAAWNLVASNDNAAAPGETASSDPYLLRTLNPATYYVVVSSKENRSADPRGFVGRVAGGTGTYVLTVAPPLPDLAGVSFSATRSDTFLANGKMTLSYAIRNVGAAAAGEFTVFFWLSDDSHMDSGSPDTWVGSKTVTSLSAMHSYRGSTDVYLPLPARTDPYCTDNEYWIGMVIVPADTWVDAVAANNANQGNGVDMAPLWSEANVSSPAGDKPKAVALGVGWPHAGNLGGDEWIGPRDVDLFSVSLAEGLKYNIDLDRTSGALDSYVRVYDSKWHLLAANDNGAGPDESEGVDSFLTYLCEKTGTYYVVVSDVANGDADPTVLAGRSAGATGQYTVTVSSVDADLAGTSLAVSPSDPASNGGAVGADFAIANLGERESGPFRIKFFLSADSTISGADTVVGSYVCDGVKGYSTIEDHVALALPATDPFRDSNRYWIGMIVDDRNDVAESDETNNSNRGEGLDTAAVSSEAHVPSATDGVNADPTSLRVGASASAAIGDEWIGARDIDTYRVQVPAGRTIGFDVDSAGGFDSYLRLYDANWALLAASDNTAGPGEGPGSDSYIERTFDASTLVYVVVSAAANSAADARLLTGRAASGTGNYTLSALNIAPDLNATAADGPGQLVWGQTLDVDFSIGNAGFRPSGAFEVGVYLSSDATISAQDFCVGRYAIADLPAGLGQAATLSVTLPAVAPAGFPALGTVYLGVLADPDQRVADPVRADNAWASSAQQITVPVQALDAKRPVVFPDQNGDIVTVKLTGKGFGVVMFVHNTPSDMAAINLAGTDAKSKLAVTVRKAGAGDGRTPLPALTVDGSLGGLDVRACNLADDILVDGGVGKLQAGVVTGGHTITLAGGTTFPGGGTLTFGAVSDLTLDSAMAIKSLTATNWLDTGAADVIRAPWIAKLNIKGAGRAQAGDFGVGLETTNLSTPAGKAALDGVKVTGDVVGG